MEDIELFSKIEDSKYFSVTFVASLSKQPLINVETKIIDRVFLIFIK
ncbi:hypothetical protein ACOTWR_03745 [Aliarcobacter butzleri]|nr:hypothetical protein [Aliarcobacter butzleri]MCT7562159.1 hypothetical protein [Aliarcobacter butzleri]